MMERHVDNLKLRHSMLESLVASENKRPAADESVLRALKRQKLRLKDEIAAKLRAHRVN